MVPINTSLGAYIIGKVLEHFYPILELFFKVRIGIVENLLAAMLNTKQPKEKGSPASVWP